ncbi:aldo/keto reductase [Pseudoroseicyclus tamaricis]|uniref:Aldo/keto reductase n=1 Tax=Pseudoroseicyclus tamaricis TaxID=2705421 RepID=A0A6B2K0C0_9RHOB|nr:aldo/keto reductase [Pseudoroseicyclus tamaricis]NDV02389.1 aldo/keto reductase [Pseudoroseicyclus tamaricis]
MVKTLPGPAGIPALGFGTVRRKGEDGIAPILAAIESGCRHIDTAQAYGTEAEVGEAVRRSGLPRDELFVVTKIDPANFGEGKLIPSLEESLRQLEMEAVDLTLIHWPSPNGEVPLEVYLRQLAEAKARGLTRHIGVSNFPIALLKEATAILGEGEIACNQVELNPLFKNRTLADWCQDAGIGVVCYQPIAGGRMGEDAEITAIAEARGATPAQVALAWELAKGYCAIPTTSKPERARENMGALELSLTEDEIATIDSIPDVGRRIDPETAPEWD